MENQKQVILWTPKRAEKLSPSGQVMPGEYVGKFSTKVPAGTPGAIHNKGKNEAGIEWDHWEKHVDSINGKLRWIDKQSGGDKFGAKIVMYLESDKYLHQISVPYDKGFDLAKIMNNLCGLRADVATYNINVAYWVRKKTDYKTKAVITDNNGKPIWQKSIEFRDMSPEFDRDAWNAFAEKNDLTAFHQTTPNGDKVWNNYAELKYWDTRMCHLQRFLLKTPDVLPFTYNSMIACEARNPSGGENLTSDEIQTAKEIFERVRHRYRFPYSRTETSADDFMEDTGSRNASIDLGGNEQRYKQPDNSGFHGPASVQPRQEPVFNGWVPPTKEPVLIQEEEDQLPF